MTNEATQDAEESATIEKTALEQPESSTATAEAVAPETPQAEILATETPAPQAEESQNTADDFEPTAEGVGSPTPETAETVEEPASDPVEVAAVSEAPTDDAPAPVESAAAPEIPIQHTQPPRTPNRVVKAPKPKLEAVQPDEARGSGEIDFGAILEQFEQEQTVFHAGELVEGTVVGVTDRGVLVDFGYKSEGFVPVEEFTGAEGEMTAVVGETIEVIIRTIHSGDGAPQLSRLDALGRKVWDEIEAAFQSETPVTGRVMDKTKGGLRIDLNGLEAFLPGSQIDSRPIRGLDTYIGHDIEAKIIKFSRRRNNIVLSRKVLTDAVVNVQKAETLGRIDLGHIVDGTIKNLTEYGAFVDIGGIDGLLHVTDMSWGRIHHPGDLFKVGEHLQVKVLKLDREKEKVSLGYKQLLPDPWSTVVEVYPVNTKIKGIVSSVTEYGVFVELEPGVEGLVHVSEISWSRRSQSPKRMYHKGQEVEVQVLGVDTVEKRISLGMKQFQDNPWDTVDLKYPIGAKIIGRVRNLTDFGAFIELEEGIDGLVHVSDISWAKKIKHPKDVLKKDQEVEAVVTSIDKRGQRLSLSMKDLTPSAWEGFVATHRPGDIVKGKVSRFTNFGVFVELGEGLEGLCHISELSDERVDRAESVAELGQEMDFKILRIEPADQKIGLSHRAVGKENEPVVDTKMYSTEAKGGMASLSELANLKFGDAAEKTPAQVDPEEKKKLKQAAKKARAEEFAAKEAEAAIAPEPTESVAAQAEEADSADSGSVGKTAETPAAEESATPVAETNALVAESTEETPGPEVAEAAESAVSEQAEPPVEAEAAAEIESAPVADESAAIDKGAPEVADKGEAVAPVEADSSAAAVDETAEGSSAKAEIGDGPSQPATEDDIASVEGATERPPVPDAEPNEVVAKTEDASSESVNDATVVSEDTADDIPSLEESEKKSA